MAPECLYHHKVTLQWHFNTCTFTKRHSRYNWTHVTSLGAPQCHLRSRRRHYSDTRVYIITRWQYSGTRVCASSQGGTTLTLRHMFFTRRCYNDTWEHVPSLGDISVTLEFVYHHYMALQWHVSICKLPRRHYSDTWAHLHLLEGISVTLECV